MHSMSRLENWRVMLISAFNYVIVEVVAEIGNKDIRGRKTKEAETHTDGK